MIGKVEIAVIDLYTGLMSDVFLCFYEYKCNSIV